MAVKFIETEIRMVVAKSSEEEDTQLLFNGDRVSVGEDVKVLETDSSDS
jgi:hypothetical protein